MQEEPFKIGELVRLKSDGPLMTVSQVKDSPQIECVWFERVTLHREVFHKDAIRRPVGGL